MTQVVPFSPVSSPTHAARDIAGEEEAFMETVAIDKNTLLEEWRRQALLAHAHPLNLMCLPMYPCEWKNLDDKVNSLRLSFTDDGVEFQEGPYFVRCRWAPCGMQGHLRQFVAFREIDNVRLQEPAGNYCGCFPHKLSLVSVHAASARTSHPWTPGMLCFHDGEANRADLELWGLRSPDHFVKELLVRRKQAQARLARRTLAEPPQQAVMMDAEQHLDEQVHLLQNLDAHFRSLAGRAEHRDLSDPDVQQGVQPPLTEHGQTEACLAKA